MMGIVFVYPDKLYKVTYDDICIIHILSYTVYTCKYNSSKHILYICRTRPYIYRYMIYMWSSVGGPPEKVKGSVVHIVYIISVYALSNIVYIIDPSPLWCSGATITDHGIICSSSNYPVCRLSTIYDSVSLHILQIYTCHTLDHEYMKTIETMYTWSILTRSFLNSLNLRKPAFASKLSRAMPGPDGIHAGGVRRKIGM